MLPCNNRTMKRCCLVWSLLFVVFGPMLAAAASDSVLPEGTRIALQLNNPLSTRVNSEGDAFTAVVTAPVYLGDRMVIPKGSKVTGSIARITRPGRVKGKAVMNLQFQSISIPGRGQVPITATLVRVDSQGNGGVRSEGSVVADSSAGRDSARVLTPAAVGGGIGAITHGAAGAGIGVGVGAAIGLTSVFTSRGKDIEVRRGSTMDIALDRPLTIPPQGEDAAARNR